MNLHVLRKPNNTTIIKKFFQIFLKIKHKNECLKLPFAGRRGKGGEVNWKFPLCVVDKCLTEKINSFPTFLKFILRFDNGNS